MRKTHFHNLSFNANKVGTELKELMTQPTVFSAVSSPQREGLDDSESATPCEADLYASDFTYSFLKGVDTVGPNRPRTVNIPKKILDAMGNMERQYWEIKAAHFDIVVFFKKGKFYEIYDCDAVTASREFGLKMTCDSTNRGKMRMAGVPEQSFAEWARLFVFRGYKIGRVEQMSRDEEEEAAAGAAKAKVVPRELVQILTPGTLTDPAMITGHQAHFVLGLCPIARDDSSPSSSLAVGAFAVDLSRNVVYRCPCYVPEGQVCSIDNLLAAVAALMHHLHPKEVVVPSMGAVKKYLMSGALSEGTEERLMDLVKVLRAWLSNNHHCEVEDVEVAHIENYLHQHRQQPMGNLIADFPQTILLSYFTYLKLSAVSLDQACDFTAHLAQSLDGEDASPSIPPVPSPDAGASILEYERRNDRGVVLDSAAIDNLELVSNLKDNTEQYSLYQFLNRCVTNGGKRLLRSWILRPASSTKVILERQKAITEILRSGLAEGWGSLDGTRDESESPGSKRARDSSFRSMFSSLFGVDFERSMSRLAELRRENLKVAYIDPLLQYNKNLQLILTTITGFQEMAMWSTEALRHVMDSSATQPTQHQGSVLLRELFATMARVLQPVDALGKLFDKRKAEKSGTIIPSRGAMPEYDAACDEIEDLEKQFSNELRRLKEEVFMDNNISYSDLGKDLYLVEVPINSAKKLKSNSGFVERARTAKSIKFVSTAMEGRVEQFKRATTAKSNALVAVLRTIASSILEHVVVFHEASSALSYLDCLMSLASFRSYGTPTCVPTIVEDADLSGFSASIDAKDIYHPLLSCTANGSKHGAVPNSVTLASGVGRMLVLTGPNMAGKSTLMRTIAINVLMAQLGGFAFGDAFTLAPIDRVFTRIGARDAAHRGQSTLFVELSETSDILRFANQRSLCLIDELGRGTSTHDGYAIAHATLQHLGRHGRASPLVIFSTHYHALALEVKNSDSILMSSSQLGYMDFALTSDDSDSKGDENANTAKPKKIVFLFRLVRGICTRSYGVEVAMKAGVSASIVEFAQKKSTELSKTLLEHQMLQLLRDAVQPSNSVIDAKAFNELTVRSASLLTISNE